MQDNIAQIIYNSLKNDFVVHRSEALKTCLNEELDEADADQELLFNQ